MATEATMVEAQETEATTTTTETTTNVENGQEEVSPIFEEIQGMNPGSAVNVLIQAAQMAQSTGALSVRDSVMLAQAISILRPGTI